MRGPLPENWKNTTSPIMCSYKVVEASFELWGIQSKAEEYIQKVRETDNVKSVKLSLVSYTHVITVSPVHLLWTSNVLVFVYQAVLVL